MKGKFSERVTPLMISAMRMAWSSLSITHGPAMRKRFPEPIRTFSILNDIVISQTTKDTKEHEGSSKGPFV